MDILLISRCPPFPLYHGDRLIPYHLARELSARLHRVDLLAYYQTPADVADVPRYERFFREVTLLREPARSPLSLLHRQRKQRRFPQRASESWSPEMWAAIRTALDSHAYDMVHLFGGVHVYEFRELVRPLPNVIVPYESYSLWLSRAMDEERRRVARWKLAVQRRMARSYESWMFDGFDRVVVLTDRDADALRTLNASTPTVVIPNGVDIDYFTPTAYEPDEPTLLFTGNYDYPPNRDAALRLATAIFPQVQARVPGARLCLVGGNPPPELRALASDAVQVTGRVPDIRPYFERAQVFVSALRLGAGIKNKVLEAMAMQTPVVATPLSCDGIPVIPGDDILLGETDAQIADQVVRLLADAALRRQLAANGRRLIERRFTWHRVADQYEKLYQVVIRERGGPHR